MQAMGFLYMFLLTNVAQRASKPNGACLLVAFEVSMNLQRMSTKRTR